eukprot:gene4534-6404_t
MSSERNIDIEENEHKDDVSDSDKYSGRVPLKPKRDNNPKYDNENPRRSESRQKENQSELSINRKNKTVEENRRRVKWLSFAKSKVSFGFKHLSPAYVPSMTAEKHGITICFEWVRNWSIPQQVQQEIERGEYDVTVKLSLSMFHLHSSSFFGSTWVGPEVDLPSSHSKTVDFKYEDIIYMISRISDPSCVAVVEIILTKYDTKKNLQVAQFGCGWTMLHCFAKPPPSDIAFGYENVLVTSCAMFFGSPRDLLMHNDVNRLAENLREIPDCNIFFKIFNNKKLLRAGNLVSENEAIGRFDIIPGLLTKEVVPVGSTRPKPVACIGDEERVDQNGVQLLPSFPKIGELMTVHIANCQVCIPNREMLEVKLNASFIKELDKDKSEKVQIVSRTLRIGLHNGHTIIGGDWKPYDLVEDKEDRDILFTKDETLVLSGYYPHELMTLVFIVEYEVGVPLPSTKHFDSHNVMDSTSEQTKHIIHGLTFGAAIYLPCDGKKIILKNTQHADDSEGNEDGVDIELKILRDEICVVLSPKPLLKEFSNQSADDKPMTSALVTNSVTSVRNSKASVNFASSIQTNKQSEKALDLEPMTIGFDLIINHPTKGKLTHGEDVEEYTINEPQSPRVPMPDFDDVQDDAKSIGSPGKRMSKKTFDRTASSFASSAVRDSYARESDRDDRSLYAQSIDSEKSSVRLDPGYYSLHGKAQPKKPFDVESEVSQEDSQSLDNLFVVPKNKSSLLAQSMMSKLVGKTDLYSKPTTQAGLDGELLMAPHSMNKQIAPKSNATIGGISSHVRDISRAARSRLNRHGFDGAIMDSDVTQAVGKLRNVKGMNTLMDIEKEARDPLSTHEISIQFAGFRNIRNCSTFPPNEKSNNTGPRSIYCSFQFYNCMPTRTEVMRVLPASPGEMCVLCREEAYAHDETPLALRFIIDCFSASPSEPYLFSEYVSKTILYVDVWDAEGLMLLGTCGIPLRKLLRQGQPFVKYAMECDLINPEVSSYSQSGISSTVVANDGPVAGTVVGAINIILSNSGKESNRSLPAAFTSHQQQNLPETRKNSMEELNWRAFGVERNINIIPSKDTQQISRRPKNSVRAKPLSESSPELSKALTDVRYSAGSRPNTASAMKSLTADRGGEGFSTLTYDEVAVLFRRFQGNMKGTIQYTGSLMALLDMPSWNVTVRKLILAYKKYGDFDNFSKEMLRYSDSDSKLTAKDFEEFLHAIFDKLSIRYRPEELSILSQKFSEDSKSGGMITPNQVAEFCNDESERQEWKVVTTRFRRAVQTAYLEDCDVEQLLCSFDKDGTHHISIIRFKEFLKELSQYGKLSPKDINMCCKHFNSGDRPSDPKKLDVDVISLREVMAFVGITYVGNLEARLKSMITQGHNDSNRSISEIVYCFKKQREPKTSSISSDNIDSFNYDEIVGAMGELRAFESITHQQLLGILKKVDKNNTGRVNLFNLLVHIGLSVKKTEIISLLGGVQKSSGLSIQTDSPPELDGRQLFELLMEKVQSNGVAVDEAFRHFDKNGDGFISRKEMIEGCDELCIFENIPNWKKNILEMLKKFDTNNDDQVSLQEFFKFLKVDYTPNIIQRMTKIFAVATQNGLVFRDIFKELDSDGNGEIDADELITGLKKLGTFGEVTREDAARVVHQFDSDGNEKISVDEFIEFFSSRVNDVIKDRKKKLTDKLVKRFRDLMRTAMSKGATIKDLFGHFDQDKGGSVSTDELKEALKNMPNFKSLSQSDLQELIKIIDSDNSGDVDLKEFESFVKGDDMDMDGIMGDNLKPKTIIESLRDVFKTAAARGMTFEEVFSLLDRDRSGELSRDELLNCLKKLPSFKEITSSAMDELFHAIDTDNSGLITVEEFQEFVKRGTVVEDPRKPLHTPKPTPVASNTKELFIRHMRRISDTDGSIVALLAYLDDDGDGLIRLTSLKNLLRRSDVFESLSEEECDKLLQPLLTTDSGKVSPRRKMIDATVLLRFLENKSQHKKSNVVDDDEEDPLERIENFIVPRDYEFSKDPETHAVEKKIRGLGRILAKKGIDVEKHFITFDPTNTGYIRRTEFLEVLSKLGMYLLEKGRILDQAMHPDHDIKRIQKHQINRLKGSTGGDYLNNAPRLARKMLMESGGDAAGEFKEHLESMTLINWYRQSQKQQLLQKVLSHSLAFSIWIYPRFGSTLFFEYPITNPFGHEERFIIEINDPELKLVTSYDEWFHLRKTCRPCVGELGDCPVEAEMFDQDGNGNIQVALLAHETIYLPFTYMTLIPHIPESRLLLTDINHKKLTKSKKQTESKNDYYDTKDNKYDEYDSKQNDMNSPQSLPDEEPKRIIPVKIVSGSHGHIISILKVHLCPRSFVLHRTFRFVETENNVAKRRIQIAGHQDMRLFPGEFTAAAKYIHCVESNGIDNNNSNNNNNGPNGSRVVVEWGASSENFEGLGALDILIRYRCGAFPSIGSFYLLIYNDPYQASLHEIWQVVIQTAIRVDVNGAVGSVVASDLAVRGDRFPRRVRVHHGQTPFDRISFKPNGVFQLVPGSYNRVTVTLSPLFIGHRRMLVNMVDMESKELITSWLLVLNASAPSIARSYDIQVESTRPVHKKIVFQNPWDVPRRFVLVSSDETIMKSRSATVDVAPFGNAYLRLWFSANDGNSSAIAHNNHNKMEVFLFLNDADSGQNEECYLFNIHYI